MDRTTSMHFPDSIILAQWVIGKSKEEILEMPGRFREIVSELTEEEDIYGEFILLKIGKNYLFSHFKQGEQVCTKSILELTPDQLDRYREYCEHNYLLIADERWTNTEYETVIEMVYGISLKGYVECRSVVGYKIPVWRRIRNLFQG